MGQDASHQGGDPHESLKPRLARDAIPRDSTLVSSSRPNRTAVMMGKLMPPRLNHATTVDSISANHSLSSIAFDPSISVPSSLNPYTKTDTILQEKINNGLTGQYVSLALAETVYIFWKKNIDRLSKEQQLEIGCSIYFTMVRTHKELNILLAYEKIKILGIRLLEMMGWLISKLLTNNIDLRATLVQLGIGHKAIGLNITHFITLLTGVHETFSYYFEHQYSIKVRYAFDKLLTVSAKIMMGEDDLHVSAALSMHGVQKSFDDLSFLQSTTECLNSTFGRQYLYQYFSQTFCDELVIYLQSMRRFKAATADRERFIIAKDICKTSIHSNAPFAINISYEARLRTVGMMQALETQFFDPKNNEPLEVPDTLFDQCHHEILRLIKQNHWMNFKNKITTLSNTF